MALGARPAAVLGMMVAQGAAASGVGTAANVNERGVAEHLHGGYCRMASSAPWR